MRIVFDVIHDGLRAINTAASQMADAQRQVATGRRLETPSDDPLSAQLAVGEHATLAAVDAYSRTRDAASARLASADTVLSGIVDKLTTAITTATGARGSLNAAARNAAVQGLNGLRDSLLGDFNSTFNGQAVFSGTDTKRTAYTNTGSGWTYNGNPTAVQVEVERGRLVNVTFDGQAIAKGSDTTDLFTTLDNLTAAIQAGDNTQIGAGVDALQRAFDRANRALGALGADERGVDEVTARLATLRLGSEQRRSKLEDVNLAEAATRMTLAETTYRAALGAVSSAERQSLLDYLK